MIVILLIVLLAVGPFAVLALLGASAIVASASRAFFLAFAIATIALLWAYATIDFVDMFDGPMRITAEADFVGAGAGLPPSLNPDGGPLPVWWIIALAAAAFGVAAYFAKAKPPRVLALCGLGAIAVSLASLALLDQI